MATQRLKQPVRFQLADNSEVQCKEIAYVDFSITTERRPIKLQAVPLFLRPIKLQAVPLDTNGTLIAAKGKLCRSW